MALCSRTRIRAKLHKKKKGYLRRPERAAHARHHVRPAARAVAFSLSLPVQGAPAAALPVQVPLPFA
jgi:hypothetical protein